MTDCMFLYTYYTDIYNKIVKDEIDIQILFSFFDALKEIEDGKSDQHEASFKVGSLSFINIRSIESLNGQ